MSMTPSSSPPRRPASVRLPTPAAPAHSGSPTAVVAPSSVATPLSPTRRSITPADIRLQADRTTDPVLASRLRRLALAAERHEDPEPTVGQVLGDVAVIVTALAFLLLLYCALPA